jgi:hypothetical protein
MDPFSHFGPKITWVLKQQKFQIWMIFDAMRTFQYLKIIDAFMDWNTYVNQSIPN